MGSDFEFLLSKMKQYCAYQERYIFDIQSKLHSWKVRPDVIDKIIKKLLSEDYINEERYARIFAGGKFRIKKWGRNKIFAELSKKRIPEIYVQMALQEIDDGEYLNALREILTKKENQLKIEDPVKKKHRLMQFAASKGYSAGMIMKVLDEMNR